MTTDAHAGTVPAEVFGPRSGRPGPQPRRRRFTAATWAGLDDDALNAIEDAMAYATAAQRDNYGAGYDMADPNDREERRAHLEAERVLRAVTRERERRDR